MPFWELTVPASAEVSEGLTNFLWEQGALGVVEEERPGESARLRAFFPESTPSTRLVEAARRYVDSLRALGFTADGSDPLLTPRLEEPWAEAWRQAFVPQRVGRRLLIAPPWEVPAPEDGRTTVIIEPGRAFGTGTHGSTQGCLVLLEALLAREAVAEALDVGTGSGILAIAAAALGVGRVTALDTDPDAVAAARANAARNGVAGRIECLIADPRDWAGLAAPLIVSNLLAGTHVRLAPDYRRLLARGGHLILGGLLPEEAASIPAALGPHGFTSAEHADVEGWVSLLLRG